MAQRRSFTGGLPGQGAGPGGGPMGATGGMRGAAGPSRMPMQPRIAMGQGAPNNPQPGMPGPQSGGAGGAGMPPPPPPIPSAQPMAGGPTAPMNAGSMLVNGMGQQPGAPGPGGMGSAMAQPAPKTPMPIWAQGGGNTGHAPDPLGDLTTGGADPFGLGGSAGAGISPAILLQLLKASGRL